MLSMIEEADPLIIMALREDLGDAGDVTSEALFSNERRSCVLRSKESGVLAGIEIFRRVYHHVDTGVTVKLLRRDGDVLEPGDRVAEISGRAASLLAAERVALNFLSLLSGIATATRAFVEAARRRGRTRILDTRKTIPGYRVLSKYAVKIGGGDNHRMGLYDMVLIKDNHIDSAGSVARAVKSARSRWQDRYRIEVECRSLAEVREAVRAGADIVMLDNMELPDVRAAVHWVKEKTGGAVSTEASGNVGLDDIEALAEAGVDRISVGRITHSAGAFDFTILCPEQAADHG